MKTEQIIAEIEALPDSDLYVNRDLDPLAVFPAFMTTADVKALAADFKRLTDAMEFIGVTFEGDELKIQPSRKAKWARAQLAMDNVQIQRLTEENARLREGLEHYGDELNWDWHGDSMTIYRHGQINEVDGPDHARKILGGLNE